MSACNTGTRQNDDSGKTNHEHNKRIRMNIDRMEFIAWMERIMDRFDILNDHINNIHKDRNSIDGEELLDNQDLLQMLKISQRSLQRYRSSGKLAYYTISGKLYYKLSDVHQFVRDNFNAPLQRTKDNK
ncbi:MAG TPA: helix-turn-helix domain-containing protein [Niabella sp.]|nr:helix-turn-helix domain-containing protein [Niabella sp.]